MGGVSIFSQAIHFTVHTSGRSRGRVRDSPASQSERTKIVKLNIMTVIFMVNDTNMALFTSTLIYRFQLSRQKINEFLRTLAFCFVKLILFNTVQTPFLLI